MAARVAQAARRARVATRRLVSHDLHETGYVRLHGLRVGPLTLTTVETVSLPAPRWAWSRILHLHIPGLGSLVVLTGAEDGIYDANYAVLEGGDRLRVRWLRRRYPSIALTLSEGSRG